MAYIRIKEMKNDTAYAEPIAGANIFTEIIPESVALMKKGYWNSLVVSFSCILHNIDLEINANSSVEGVIDSFWEKMDSQELEYRETKKQSSKSDNLYAYNSAQEAIDAVKAIDEAVDLKSGNTPIQEAVEFCKKIMFIVSKCDRYFIKEERDAFRKALEEKGACGLADASYKYKTNTKSAASSVYAKGNIEFPLHIFTQLTSTSPVEFFEGLQASTNQEYSAAAKWIEAQNCQILPETGC